MTENTPRIFRPVPVTGPARLWFAILLAALGLPLLWLLFEMLRIPTIRYTVDTVNLTITSALGSEHQEKTLTIARIADARPEWLRDGALRFGTEKPGYCVGFFAYPRVGEVFQISDCSSQAVILSSTGEATPVAIAPADRDGFLRALRGSQPGTFQPPGTRTASWWLTLATLLLILALVAAALWVIFFLAPSRLSYAVRGGSLTVRTLAGARAIPLAGARAMLHRPLLGQRLSGFPLPGYQIGSWMLDSMATTVLGSGRDGDGVIVEADGRFFLNPQDREGFLAALGAEGATIVTDTALRRR